MRTRLLLFALCLVGSRTAPAQERTAQAMSILTGVSATVGRLATPVTLAQASRTRAVAIAEVARQAQLIYAADESLPGMQDKVVVQAADEAAGRVLLRIVEGAPLRLLTSADGRLAVVASEPSVAAPTYRLAGRVHNRDTREIIRGAQLRLNDERPQMSTQDGLFLLTVGGGVHRLRIQALGYAPLDTSILMSASATVSFDLAPRSFQLGEVRVEENRSTSTAFSATNPQMNVVHVDPRTTRAAPTLLGEADPVRDLATLPGITLASDASAALLVRGGRADQNLYLLDGAPVYNPTHVFGLLSTFNSDAVDGLSLFKGSPPARFGGRLSSVVDIHQREGNATRVTGNVSVGLLSGRLLVEGPAFSRGSFMLAGRRSWADLVARPFMNGSEDPVAFFDDINARLTWRTGATGMWTASAFRGRDRFGIDDNAGGGWGNTIGALRWHQVLGNRLLSSVTLSRSAYSLESEISGSFADTLGWKAGIASTDLRVEQKLPWNGGGLDFGTEMSLIASRPVQFFQRSRTNIDRRGRMLALFADAERELGPRLAVRIGVRVSSFNRFGGGQQYAYRDNAPVIFDRAQGRYEVGVVTDSTQTSRSESIASYAGVEPRLALRWTLNPISSLKLSYAGNRQYLSQAYNTTIPLPTDTWEMSSPWVKPQVSSQLSVGYARQIRGGEVSVEVFQKRMHDIVGYIDGVDAALVQQVEQSVELGVGRARGVELFARKTQGPFHGWLSYTLSRSEERFKARYAVGDGPGGGIGGGDWFPAAFERTHQLSMAGTWQSGGKWSTGALFTLASGVPFTLPEARFSFGGQTHVEPGPYNGARLPAYHRLDISATRRIGARGQLQFGVLNVYNRFNPQFLGVQRAPNGFGMEAVQYSIFRALPTINYAWRF